MIYGVSIVEYKEDYANSFKALNIAWLNKFFVIEPIDEEVLSHPVKNIIDKGGNIFFAIINNEPVGCFALIKEHEEDVYELSKMAVSEEYQGKKIGNQLLEFCFEEAKRMGAKKVILFSNTILKPAIHLYKKYGFSEIDLNGAVHKRANIKMEKII
ncbi:MAG: GNAT family N-acetyltransferase [Pedobacter sp.]|nr:GNAT family N-acetyltransferase [Chitinophagaceae bacterium]